MTTTTNTEIILRTRSSVQREHRDKLEANQCLPTALVFALWLSPKLRHPEGSNREHETLFPETHFRTVEEPSMLQSTDAPTLNHCFHWNGYKATAFRDIVLQRMFSFYLIEIGS